MRIIDIDTHKPYKVFIGKDILDELFVSGYMATYTTGSKFLVVTDSEVDKFHSDTVMKSLAQLEIETYKYVIPSGEDSKNTNNLIKLLEYMAEQHFTRSDIIIALGGGVTGDLAGLAAALYMRGIRFIQIPTTLLAAVDSSVGGKTAVNLETGKNLMGAFHQPELVICDYSFLETLPDDVFAAGMTEVIKYAMISEPGIFELIADGIQKNIEEIIALCVAAKSRFVAEDEYDNGSRQLLNFGHTIGHAIEAASEYKITHGQAVAIGMYRITKACVNMDICPEDCLTQLEAALTICGLKTECVYSPDELYTWALSDKKRSVDHINLVVPEQVGRCRLMKVSIENMRDYF